jgi:hypothetical protein
MPNDQSPNDLRSRVIEKLKILGASEETANKIYDGDGRFDAVAKTLVPQALDLCIIEDQSRILNKLQSISEGQEELVKSSENQTEKLQSLSDSSSRQSRQSRAIIIGTGIIIILTAAILAVALHLL